MASIRQNADPDALPDFRNLGVTARILVAVNLFTFAAVLVAEPGWSRAFDAFVQATAIVEPPLIASLAVLYVGSPWLARAPYWLGCAAVVALAVVLSAAAHEMFAASSAGGLTRALA